MNQGIPKRVAIARIFCEDDPNELPPQEGWIPIEEKKPNCEWDVFWVKIKQPKGICKAIYFRNSQMVGLPFPAWWHRYQDIALESIWKTDEGVQRNCLVTHWAPAKKEEIKLDEEDVNDRP